MTEPARARPTDALRDEIAAFLGLASWDRRADPTVLDEVRGDGFTRKAVSFEVPDGDTIDAFLFEPCGAQTLAGVVALHQHNSEWAIGKSEIAGLAGDPLQAFGPALARRGVPVLAADTVGFESRSAQPGHGAALAPKITRAHGSPDGWLQYYNHAMHRLARGELLMTKVLQDVACSVTALGALTGNGRAGVVGHSFGGNVAIFAAALDTRVTFACASGAACSYRYKLAHGTGLEMALVIPGFASRWDFDDLMRCVAPRPLLVVSSDGDPYTADAGDLVERAQPAFADHEAEAALEHLHAGAGHALDAERHAAMVAWLAAQAGA
jgi:dienelactone hydrolase